MSASWQEEDEEFKVGGVRGGGQKLKTRFSFTEVKMLLEAVKNNRYILLRKFNKGVSAETKKQAWAEITDQINALGEHHREVRQIMKKWADLKCDGKRRAIALRGPNSTSLRKRDVGPVERMVNKILMMSPRGGGDSDLDPGEDEDLTKYYSKEAPPNPSSYSYLNLTDSSHSVTGGLELSPLSSPEKELGDAFHSSPEFDLADDGECALDFEENDDSMVAGYPSSLPPRSSTSLDPLPDNALLRMKPVHTYSRNSSQNHTSPRPPPGPSTSSVFPSVSDSDIDLSSALQSQSPSSSNLTPSVAANATTSRAVPSSSSIPPPPAPPGNTAAESTLSAASTVTSSSNSHQPSPPSSSVHPQNHPSTSDSNLSDPLPAGASLHRTQVHVAQMASQSLQQQRTSRILLTSVSQSLETLAQSVQLLVESQQEFVQESLLLQRETVDILRDFSNTALTMLRDKANSGLVTTQQPPTPRY